MKYIELTQGKRAMVDDDLYDWLSQWRWYYKPRAYGDGNVGDAARTLNGRGLTTNKTIRMHNMIMPAPPGFETDHIDCNPLNNQRSNLRSSTKSQQGWNRRRQKNNTSGHKGVYWHKRDKKWRVQLRVGGKKKFIGNFAEKEDAIKAYRQAAKKYHGEFARV